MKLLPPLCVSEGLFDKLCEQRARIRLDHLNSPSRRVGGYIRHNTALFAVGKIRVHQQQRQHQLRVTQSRRSMSTSASTRSAKRIPVLLLKTRSTPHDTYQEHFDAGEFTPHFVPVLVHQQNEATLSELENLLRQSQLKEKYGGMVFTSQRAVEAWQGVVTRVEDNPSAATTGLERTPDSDNKINPDSSSTFSALTEFPLYAVGPATSLALKTLHRHSSAKTSSRAVFARLNPVVVGEHTGNGQNLAAFILKHYNTLQRTRYFTYVEAPRLPFIPLLGMGGENYSRSRMDADDERLRKKPLLFLVGEQRRDVIPRTLMQEAEESERIEVREVEVYSTQVLQSFEEEFGALCEQLDGEQEGEARTEPEEGNGDKNVRVIVVFSPQGTNVMLRAIGYLDDRDKPVPRDQRPSRGRTQWIIATIGPTTRDFMKDKLGVEADICADQPSPEGLRRGIEEYLSREGHKS